MAEVLSQNQIDMLLAAMNSGDDSEKTKSKENLPEMRYRKYDFYSPKKFTKDKLRLLQDVFEKYARIVVSQVNSMFRFGCEIQVSTIEEQRYYEFSNALKDTDILASLDLMLQGERVNKPVLMHITLPIMLDFMDRMMGGEGDDADVSSDYVYTEIERALYSNIMSYLSEGLGDAWSNYVNMEFCYRHIEDNPTMLQVIGVDETVVIVILEVKGEDGNGGRISICLSGDLLTDIFAIYDRRTYREKNTNFVDMSEHIMDSLNQSLVDISVKLGSVVITMKDLRELREGDIINLNKPKDSLVVVDVAKRPWFEGHIGQHKNNLAVLIEEVYHVKGGDFLFKEQVNRMQSDDSKGESKESNNKKEVNKNGEDINCR